MVNQRLAKASILMAFGTIVSRLTGFVRMLLLIAVLGTALNADIFELSNSIPNSLYILVAGGVFNVVLVPLLVRAMKEQDDGGEAYVNRIVTLALIVLGTATVLLMIAVPVIMRIPFGETLFEPGFENHRAAARLLMTLTMPQVFFYGMFVLVGQILNSREKFGPMMWAPVINNLVSIGVLALYAVIFGIATPPANDGFSNAEVWLLGVGSTLGIAVQAAVLVPFLRATGFRYRPRFDFRGVGLNQTVQLGGWALAFIVVNQAAYFTIAKIASEATLTGRKLDVPAAGQAVYALGHLISQVPHGIITVSVATAIIPTLTRLGAENDFLSFRRELGSVLRIALVIVAPLAVAVAVLGLPLGHVVGGIGSAASSAEAIGHTISAFSITMVAFCFHYMTLRGFYALSDTRTPFFVQAAIAALNVALAFALSSLVTPIWTSTMLALAYGLAYVGGFILSASLLSRRVGGFIDSAMRAFLYRLALVCLLAGGVMFSGRVTWQYLGWDHNNPLSALLEVISLGLVGAAITVGAMKLVRIQELSQLVQVIKRRRSGD